MEKVWTELEEMIAKAEVQNPGVSVRGVDWHLSHAFQAIISVNKAIKHSDPATYKWKFNWVRAYVFGLNKIPRGKGRAPKEVLAEEVISVESLTSELAEARRRWQEIIALSPRHNFPHPYFGTLNRKQTERFLKIHTVHHLKIMRDIVG